MLGMNERKKACKNVEILLQQKGIGLFNYLHLHKQLHTP
jgi:hypothetical protein